MKRLTLVLIPVLCVLAAACQDITATARIIDWPYCPVQRPAPPDSVPLGCWYDSTGALIGIR